MSVSEAVERKVMGMKPGLIFEYNDIPAYTESPAAVIKAVGRMVKAQKIERAFKGKFYIPKQGLLGSRRLSDEQLIKSAMYKNSKRTGYITGPAMYNKLGLTTQVPKTVTIAGNGGRQTKAFSTITIKTVVASAPVEEKNVRVLQLLDALKDIKKIPDSDVNVSLKIIRRYIDELPEKELRKMLTLSENYYNAQTKALVGLLFSSLKLKSLAKEALSLNPTTTYKLNLDENKWPLAREWNIQ